MYLTQILVVYSSHTFANLIIYSEYQILLKNIFLFIKQFGVVMNIHFFKFLHF